MKERLQVISELFSFLGKQKRLSILYIRRCYHYMKKIVFNDNTRKLLITGNPGTGKLFLVLLALSAFATKKCKNCIFEL